MLQVIGNRISFVGKLRALQEALDDVAKHQPSGITLLEYCRRGVR
jgi:hypothetical protein